MVLHKINLLNIVVIHQEQAIQEGILDSLLKLISVDKPSLQLKVLSVIQHFDGESSILVNY